VVESAWPVCSSVSPDVPCCEPSKGALRPATEMLWKYGGHCTHTLHLSLSAKRSWTAARCGRMSRIDLRAHLCQPLRQPNADAL